MRKRLGSIALLTTILFITGACNSVDTKPLKPISRPPDVTNFSYKRYCKVPGYPSIFIWEAFLQKPSPDHTEKENQWWSVAGSFYEYPYGPTLIGQWKFKTNGAWGNPPDKFFEGRITSFSNDYGPKTFWREIAQKDVEFFKNKIFSLLELEAMKKYRCEN